MRGKKLLAILLSLCMVMGLMPSLVFADEVAGGDAGTVYGSVIVKGAGEKLITGNYYKIANPKMLDEEIGKVAVKQDWSARELTKGVDTGDLSVEMDATSDWNIMIDSFGDTKIGVVIDGAFVGSVSGANKSKSFPITNEESHVVEFVFDYEQDNNILGNDATIYDNQLGFVTMNLLDMDYRKASAVSSDESVFKVADIMDNGPGYGAIRIDGQGKSGECDLTASVVKDGKVYFDTIKVRVKKSPDCGDQKVFKDKKITQDIAAGSITGIEFTTDKNVKIESTDKNGQNELTVLKRYEYGEDERLYEEAFEENGVYAAGTFRVYVDATGATEATMLTVTEVEGSGEDVNPPTNNSINIEAALTKNNEDNSYDIMNGDVSVGKLFVKQGDTVKELNNIEGFFTVNMDDNNDWKLMVKSDIEKIGVMVDGNETVVAKGESYTEITMSNDVSHDIGFYFEDGTSEPVTYTPVEWTKGNTYTDVPLENNIGGVKYSQEVNHHCMLDLKITSIETDLTDVGVEITAKGEGKQDKIITGKQIERASDKELKVYYEVDNGSTTGYTDFEVKLVNVPNGAEDITMSAINRASWFFPHKDEYNLAVGEIEKLYINSQACGNVDFEVSGDEGVIRLKKELPYSIEALKVGTATITITEKPDQGKTTSDIVRTITVNVKDGETLPEGEVIVKAGETKTYKADMEKYSRINMNVEGNISSDIKTAFKFKRTGSSDYVDLTSNSNWGSRYTEADGKMFVTIQNATNADFTFALDKEKIDLGLSSQGFYVEEYDTSYVIIINDGVDNITVKKLSDIDADCSIEKGYVKIKTGSLVTLSKGTDFKLQGTKDGETVSFEFNIWHNSLEVYGDAISIDSGQSKDLGQIKLKEGMTKKVDFTVTSDGIVEVNGTNITGIQNAFLEPKIVKHNADGTSSLVSRQWIFFENSAEEFSAKLLAKAGENYTIYLYTENDATLGNLTLNHALKGAVVNKPIELVKGTTVLEKIHPVGDVTTEELDSLTAESTWEDTVVDIVKINDEYFLKVTGNERREPIVSLKMGEEVIQQMQVVVNLPPIQKGETTKVDNERVNTEEGYQYEVPVKAGEKLTIDVAGIYEDSESKVLVQTKAPVQRKMFRSGFRSLLARATGETPQLKTVNSMNTASGQSGAITETAEEDTTYFVYISGNNVDLNISAEKEEADKPTPPVVTPPVEPEKPSKPEVGDDGKVEIETGKPDANGKVEADVPTDVVDSALDKVIADVEAGKKDDAVVEIKVDTKDDAKAEAIDVKVDSAAIDKISKTNNAALKIESKVGALELDNDVLKEISKNAGGEKVSISIAKPKVEDMPAKQQDKIKDIAKDGLVFDLSITAGGNKISDLGGKATLSIDYDLPETEIAEGLKVYFVDDNGKATPVSAKYDAKTKKLVMVTDHLSVYVVSYVDVPSKVKVLKANNAAGKASLRWSRAINDPEGYRVYRAAAKDGKYKPIAWVKNGKAKTFKEKAKKTNKTYYYKVRSYKKIDGKCVWGAYSPVKVVKF